jgi:hypothetical protein
LFMAVLLTNGTCGRQTEAYASYLNKVHYMTQERFFMDAKWNDVVDNMAVRLGMVIVGFGAWIALSYTLLS